MIQIKNKQLKMGELSITDVFLRLKPICESFDREPSSSKANQIAQLIRRTPSSIVQKICEIVVYPITRALRDGKIR